MVVFHVFENSDPSSEVCVDFGSVTTVNEGSTVFWVDLEAGFALCIIPLYSANSYQIKKCLSKLNVNGKLMASDRDIFIKMCFEN